jgi:succinate dehydrogenase/fumarate reductase flavoprotein subunit
MRHNGFGYFIAAAGGMLLALTAAQAESLQSLAVKADAIIAGTVSTRTESAAEVDFTIQVARTLQGIAGAGKVSKSSTHGAGRPGDPRERYSSRSRESGS